MNTGEQVSRWSHTFSVVFKRSSAWRQHKAKWGGQRLLPAPGPKIWPFAGKMAPCIPVKAAIEDLEITADSQIYADARQGRIRVIREICGSIFWRVVRESSGRGWGAI